ncbi:MAG: type II secretion system protein [Pyrinomonadaceae bacterium]
MTANRKHNPVDAHAGERGYTLVALLAVMTILALLMTSAAPRLQQQAQRDREREAIARGEEVAEAIAVYTSLKQAPPTSMDQLLEGVEPFPGAFKKMMILRREAARDPLSEKGEWKLVRPNDRTFIDFQAAVAKYNNGVLPPQFIYKSFTPPQAAVTGIVDLKGDTEEAPGGEDTEPNGSGPFIGVVSRSRRKSVLAYYGIERHDRWVFTPAYR